MKLNSLFLVEYYNVEDSISLGVWFDSESSFSMHVHNICKSCFAQIRDHKLLRGYLTPLAALMAANALVGSQLDYSVFRSLSALDLRKLQCVQNSLARTLLSIHTSLRLGRLSIGCPLNTVPYSILPYWCTSSYIVVIQNIVVHSCPFLKPRHSVYNTRKSQADGVFLEVPHFAPSV